jgi:hypothetical protein
MSSGRFPRRMFGMAGLLFLVLMLVTAGRGVTAQDATTSTGEMGDCVTALGIGAEGDSCINVVHASPDAPLVDIYLDGELALTGLGFGWYSGWIAVPAGDHRVQVTVTGEAPETAVIDATVTVESGAAYQIAATGFVAEITPQIFPVDFSEIAEDTARVRVVHTVPDAPAVDVAVTGGDVLVGGLVFPNASDFLDVPAGAYDLEVRIAGTTDVALPLPGVELASATVYDVFAIGTAADGALAALIVPSPVVSSGTATAGCAAALGIGGEGDACINVVHASPDAPAVDVYLNGDHALSGLEFGAFSGWVAVPAGDYQVQVTAAGQAPETAVIDATVTVEADAAYHVAATGLLAEIAPQIYPVDLSQTGADNARVRVVHASPDAPAVDVAVTGGDVLVAGLAFPNASDALEVPAGTYDLEVRPAGSTDVALPLPGVALEAGMVYDVFAIGQLGDGTLTVLVVPSMAAHGE